MGTYPINFIHLRKAELEYEVLIRGGMSGTCLSLRSQINILSKEYGCEDISESGLDESEDLSAVKVTIDNFQSCLSEISTKAGYSRALSYKTHITYRLARIKPSSPENVSIKQKLDSLFKSAVAELNNLEAKYGSTATHSDNTNAESTNTNITVSCKNHVQSKPKYDGKSCVRSFIQKIEEFRISKKLDKNDMLDFAYDIFTEDALHWFRHVKQGVSTWDQLLEQLKMAFDINDYDYRLLSEIRQRTQGGTESITIYISIMSGLFNRLSTKLSDQEKFDIISHNVKPIYTEVLAISNVQTLEQLESVCRNYENYKARAATYQEPTKGQLQTLAPDFVYSKPNSKYTPSTYNSFKNNNYRNYQQSYKNPSTDSQGSKPVSMIYTKTQQVTAPTPFCPRCRVNTHSLRKCTVERFPICFKCGDKGVTFPNCTKCNPKN